MTMDGERTSRKSSSYRGVSRTSRNAWGVKYSGKRIKSTCRTEQEAARLYDGYLRQHQPEKYVKLANFCPTCDADRIKWPGNCSCRSVQQQSTRQLYNSSSPQATPSGACTSSERVKTHFYNGGETSPSSVVMGANPSSTSFFKSEDVDMDGSGSPVTPDVEQNVRFSLTDTTDYDPYGEDSHSRKRSFSESALMSEATNPHSITEQRGPVSLDFSRHVDSFEPSFNVSGLTEVAGKNNNQLQYLQNDRQQEPLQLLNFANSASNITPSHTKSKLSFGSSIFDCSDPDHYTDPAYFAARALINLHRTTN